MNYYTYFGPSKLALFLNDRSCRPAPFFAILTKTGGSSGVNLPFLLHPLLNGRIIQDLYLWTWADGKISGTVGTITDAESYMETCNYIERIRFHFSASISNDFQTISDVVITPTFDRDNPESEDFAITSPDGNFTISVTPNPKRLTVSQKGISGQDSIIYSVVGFDSFSVPSHFRFVLHDYSRNTNNSNSERAQKVFHFADRETVDLYPKALGMKYADISPDGTSILGLVRFRDKYEVMFCDPFGKNETRLELNPPAQSFLTKLEWIHPTAPLKVMLNEF